MMTIGVLGGMGPQATVDFLGKLVRLAGDECPRIIVDLDPTIPSRTLAAMGKGEDPGQRIALAIKRLEAQGAEIIAVPCNSAHAWYPKDIGRWLHLPSIVSMALRKRFIINPLIIGGYTTVEKRVYGPYIPGAQYLSSADNELIYDLIAEIKRARVVERWMSAKLAQVIGPYRDNMCDAFLLACTELSIIWPEDESGEPMPLCGTPVIDSSWEYAKAVVEQVKGDERGD